MKKDYRWVAMKCETEEKIEEVDRFLKPSVLCVSYRARRTTPSGYKYNHISSQIGARYPVVAADTSTIVQHQGNTLLLDGYNPELFAAIASMSSELAIYPGEWYVATERVSGMFTAGNLYQVKSAVGGLLNVVKDDKGSSQSGGTLELFRRANIQELIDHFSKNTSQDVGHLDEFCL